MSHVRRVSFLFVWDIWIDVKFFLYYGSLSGAKLVGGGGVSQPPSLKFTSANYVGQISKTARAESAGKPKFKVKRTLKVPFLAI